MQLIKLHISDSNVILINLYAPNNDDVNFYNTLENTIKDYEDETLIIGGDFNAVLDYNFDK
jgi:exonuclease III